MSAHSHTADSHQGAVHKRGGLRGEMRSPAAPLSTCYASALTLGALKSEETEDWPSWEGRGWDSVPEVLAEHGRLRSKGAALCFGRGLWLPPQMWTRRMSQAIREGAASLVCDGGEENQAESKQL